MTSSDYRLKNPIMVVVNEGNRHRLHRLPAKSVFHVTCSKPDPNGMIEGICEGNSILMFFRDLEDRTEPIHAK